MRSLEDRIDQDVYRHSLGLMRDAVDRLWSEQKVVRDFTFHDLKHSQRVARFVEQMLTPGCFFGNDLTADEAYVLSAAIYLHDIGNQCVEPNVLSKFDITLPPDRPTSDLPLDIQAAIRDKHHLIGAEWISYLYRLRSSAPTTALERAVKSIPAPRLVKPIMDVGMYHSQLLITQCELKFDLENRKRVLALLLRLADELDIAHDRVDIDTVKLFRLLPQNALYWWLHYLTQTTIDETGQLIFQLRIHEEDRHEIELELKALAVDRFVEKNRLLIGLLWPMGVHLHLNVDHEQLIQTDTFEGRLPPEIADEIRRKVYKLQKDSESGPPSMPLGKPHRLVLVVEDDHKWLAWFVEHILDTTRCQIDLAAATDFPTTLESVSRQMPDLLITDVYLAGGQTGFDLLKQLPVTLPVIVVTGSQNIVSEQLGESFGQIKDFIMKQKMSPERLNTAIARVLETLL